MAGSKMRRAIDAVKDQTSIGLARVGGSAASSELDVAIVKATSHDDYPADERHVREILSLTTYSQAYVAMTVGRLARRLSRTRNWKVALKSLMLVHRLLADGDATYEQEVFFATSRGTRLLNMSDFRDAFQSHSWDFSAFVRTYALYLDELLEWRMHARRHNHRGSIGGEEDDVDAAADSVAAPAPQVNDMKTPNLFPRFQHLQQLLERFLACRPTGAAKWNRIVLVALYPVVKESIRMYYDTTEVMGALIDRFMEMEVGECTRVHELFSRTGKQFQELDAFYAWCRDAGVARSTDFPDVERISQKKLDVMDDFIRDKSALAHSHHRAVAAPKPPAVASDDEDEDDDGSTEPGMNSIKALPPPEGIPGEEKSPPPEATSPAPETEKSREPDLLDLGSGDAAAASNGGDLSLMLLGSGGESQEGSGASAWEAVKESADWETALVQSATHLPRQPANLGGGFDMLLLDGMYARRGHGAEAGTGSASSVALGSAGRPAAALALPAPPGEGTGAECAASDPFSASLGVAPPPYVQMSEMEKKQRLLVDEQMMWQRYARDGMQGHLAGATAPPPPHTGAFTGR